MVKKQKATDPQIDKETAEQSDERKPASKRKNKKIEILLPVSGKFGLSASVGDKISIDEKQANEVVETGHAKFIK